MRDATLRETVERCSCRSDVGRVAIRRYRGSAAAVIDSTSAYATPPVRIEVVDRDAVEVALEILTVYGIRPLVMILADADAPGGCVFGGGNMQEESLFRRTSLFASLTPDAYPIADDEALYARDVDVFFDTEERRYAPFAEPVPTLDFVACPGIKMPPTTRDFRLFPEDEAALRVKFRLIARICVENGHRALVAGALGCGVWGCPPRHVAEIFKDVLLGDDEFAGAFDRITFAILGALRHDFARVLSG